MTSEERDLINGLFNRLHAADTGSKDQEAEQLIGQLTSGQPGAPYRLVQTLLVQEHALNNATVRIQQLEKQVADGPSSAQQNSGGGSFLSGLFGHHAAAPAAPTPARPQAAQTLPIAPQQLPPQTQQYVQNPPPYPSTIGMAPSAGGGFLRGALQTAAGVAGGSLVAEGIESLMGHHSGPFGGFGGGGGLFGGGGYGGGGGFGGYGGGGEVIENNQVVNNYIDERGTVSSGGGDPAYQAEQREDNRGDADSAGSTFQDTGFDASNPFDAPAADSTGSMVDNTFDTDNTDASGGDFGGDSSGSSGSDDGSSV